MTYSRFGFRSWFVVFSVLLMFVAPAMGEVSEKEATEKAEFDKAISAVSEGDLIGRFKAVLPLAEVGNTVAQFNLGLVYEKGEGVGRDPTQAFFWYRKAAEAGNSEAQLKLMLIYGNGIGVPQDPSQAFFWCRKAAEAGNSQAQFLLGDMCIMFAQDPSNAVVWFRKAAEAGNSRAQFKLGEMYGKGEGVTKDLAQALVWYRRAAEAGNSQAQFKLGEMYGKGKGVAHDPYQALFWCRKAAEAGNSEAQFMLGAMYSDGFYDGVVIKDQTQAVFWFRKAAEAGNSQAQFMLGLMYLIGEGVTKDLAQAVVWYRKAAEAGNQEAQLNLGVMYHEGEGVTRDPAQAVVWYRKAAEAGNSNAQFKLGAMYSKGEGVLQSTSAAVDWYYRAGLGYLKAGEREKALTALDRINNISSGHRLGKKLEAAIYQGEEEASDSEEEPGTKAKKPATSQGTGWVAAGGIIVTNWHVVNDGSAITVVLPDGKNLPAQLLAQDRMNDLALLKVEGGSLPAGLPLAKVFTKPGAKVFCLGYPHADIMGRAAKLTSGEISSTSGVLDDPRTYQITVPLQAGSSGGPLLNMQGEVVGVVTSKLAAVEMFKWTGDLPQNVNYAVKVQYLAPLLEGNKAPCNSATLPAGAASLEDLAERVKGSVVMVLAE